MQIAIATFEHLPIRVGGLAEAATSIGEALVKLGAGVMVLMPSHGLHKKPGELSLSKIAEFEIDINGKFIPTAVFQGTRRGVELFLLSNDVLDRENVYGPGLELPEKILHFAKAVPVFLNHFIRTTGKKPDIFHSNDWHAVLAAETVKKYFRIPYLYTIHRICRPQVPTDFISAHGLADFVQEKFVSNNMLQIEPLGGDGCKLLNTVSLTYLEEEWERFFKRYEGKATYVWNGIDASFWDPEKLKNPKLSRSDRKKALLSSNNLPDGTLYFYVGRLDFEQKGVDHFIHAIERVMSNGSREKEKLRFVILGSGEKRLEDQIRALEQKYPSHVKGILGYLEREVTREYYASADFCVIPSNFEPFGLVQLEAMCLGSIPVGTKVGGINDTVIDAAVDPERGTGRLVPPRNPEALATVLTEVAEFAPAFMDRLRKNGRLHATRDFTWENAAKRYLQLYRDEASVKISYAKYPEPF